MQSIARKKGKKASYCAFKPPAKPKSEANMETANGVQINCNNTACSDMLASFSELFGSGDFSDLTIFCRDRKFEVHRAIICPRSKVLARMCEKGDGAFEVPFFTRWHSLFGITNALQEALTGKIHLKGDDPMIVEKMISFLYRLDYADCTPHENWDADPVASLPIAVKAEAIAVEAESITVNIDPFEDVLEPSPLSMLGVVGHDESVLEPAEVREPLTDPASEESIPGPADDIDRITPLVLNARVYTIGERYDIWALKELAQQKFVARAKNGGWNSEDFSLAIREVYEWTTDEDQGLRQLLVTIAAEHIKALRDRGEFNEVISDVPDFTRRLLIEVLQTKYSSQGVYCRTCQVNGYASAERGCINCGRYLEG
ncbi:MAG: hypothetical protein M1835_000208 [Candelina submexicana]|nr:MAG: hypothetical protein M1835_000208 [Candelina submexicana]